LAAAVEAQEMQAQGQAQGLVWHQVRQEAQSPLQVHRSKTERPAEQRAEQRAERCVVAVLELRVLLGAQEQEQELEALVF
jgi:hypothetical protein